jgi:hypothetical protein
MPVFQVLHLEEEMPVFQVLHLEEQSPPLVHSKSQTRLGVVDIPVIPAIQEAEAEGPSIQG